MTGRYAPAGACNAAPAPGHQSFRSGGLHDCRFAAEQERDRRNRAALAAFGAARRALRSQVPTLALMIGYTALSLWILAQPVVELG